MMPGPNNREGSQMAEVTASGYETPGKTVDALSSGYDQRADVVELKALGQAFIDRCNAQGKSREMSLAITNAEQAVMWAVKAVTG